MTISGLGSSIEFGRETTYGTPVAPTVSVPFLSHNIGRTPKWSESEAIRHANSLMVADDRTISGHDVAGDISFPLYDKGLGLWFLAAYGGSQSYTYTPGTPNTHTFVVAPSGAPLDVSIYADLFIGAQTNALTKETTGLMPTGFTISGAQVENTSTLQVDFPLVGSDLTRNNSKTADGTLTPDPLEAFAWAGAAVTLNGNSECVQDWSMTVTVPKAPRWCSGSPIIDGLDRSGGRPEITGELTLYFEDWNEANAMDLGTELPLVLTVAETGTPSTNHSYVWTNNVQLETPSEDYGAVNSVDRIEVNVTWKAVSSTPGDNDLSAHSLVISNTDGDLMA